MTPRPTSPITIANTCQQASTESHRAYQKTTAELATEIVAEQDRNRNWNNCCHHQFPASTEKQYSTFSNDKLSSLSKT